MKIILIRGIFSKIKMYDNRVLNYVLSNCFSCEQVERETVSIFRVYNTFKMWLALVGSLEFEKKINANFVFQRKHLMPVQLIKHI